MTENEAIKIINDKYETFFALSTTNDFDMAMATAIKALEEIQQYRAIGTIKQFEWCKDASHWKELFKEKLEKYEAIGTVEELQKMKGVITDFPIDCGSPISNVEEILNQLKKYLAIGTIEEFKALKEKNTPYKPKEYEDRYYACKCDNILLPKWRKYPTELMPKSEGLPHCMACGQKLDWQ